jgi:Asp-tRNA(Asn)/Glu-tRNA(Gln) amidotransferase C subunit
VRELPTLAQAVAGSEVDAKPSHDIAEAGAADAVRDTGEETGRVARRATPGARRPGRQARNVPAAAWAEGQVKGVTASADDLAVARYDELTADEIVAKLAELSQVDLATVEVYERKHDDRSTIRTRISALRGDEPWPGYDGLTAAEIVAKLPELSQVDLATVEVYERKHDDRSTIRTRISALRGDEPWPGYDELTVDEIRVAVSEVDDGERASAVRVYEQAHKNRAGVLDAIQRQHANA